MRFCFSALSLSFHGSRSLTHRRRDHPLWLLWHKNSPQFGSRTGTDCSVSPRIKAPVTTGFRQATQSGLSRTSTSSHHDSHDHLYAHLSYNAGSCFPGTSAPWTYLPTSSRCARWMHICLCWLLLLVPIMSAGHGGEASNVRSCSHFISNSIPADYRASN